MTIRVTPNSVEELDEIADDYVARVKAALRTVVRKHIQELGRNGVVTVDDLNGIKRDWETIVEERLGPDALQLWLDASERTALQLGEALRPLVASAVVDLSPTPLLSESVAARDYLSHASNRIRDVGESAWSNARNDLTTGMQAGEGIGTLADRVSGSLDKSFSDAERIARTEVISASNAGSIDTMRASGVVSRKTWLAALDARTRETHAEADGQEVGLDETFDIGGSAMDHPGDPAGPPEETINCRCSMEYTVDEGDFAEEVNELETEGDVLEADAAYEHYESIAPDTISSLDQGALETYWNNEFGEINAGLRAGSLTEQQQFVVDQMTQLGSQIRTAQNTQVYRGVSGIDSILPTNATGAVIREGGFMSTSTNFGSASNYLGSQAGLINLRVPPGTKSIPVNKVLNHGPLETEFEIILMPGTKYRVISDKLKTVYGQKVRVIDAVVEP